MVIKSYEITNFKSIEQSGEIELPKITILIGANSSGKSSIIQSLLLMKQTFEAEEPFMALVINGQYLKFGEYKEFIHNKNVENDFAIKFNFEQKTKLKKYICEVCNKPYNKKTWFLKHV
jgi:predicted ATPase